MVRRVLIDGGEKKHAGYIRGFLRRRGVRHIHHLVCSHLHRDHAAGLIELVKDRSLTFDCAWVHRPEENVDMEEVSEALTATAGNRASDFLLESIRTQQTLVEWLESRDIPIEQPFKGGRIGFLEVCGPTRKYYRELLSTFRDRAELELLEEQLGHRRGGSVRSKAMLLIDELLDEAFGLSAAPVTQPENHASTILGCVFEGKKYLFTADAGAQALERARRAYQLSNCAWMQIPHHGSRKNITERLIEYFRPKLAFVSADGARHPHESVIAAFEAAGTRVLGTHKPRLRALHYKIDRIGYRVTFSAAPAC